MGTKLERVTGLLAAYEWENNRIKEWLESIKAAPGDTDIEKRFAKSWVGYFEEIKGSNLSAIKICQDAKDANTEAAADKAIKEIDNKFLKEEHIVKLKGEAKKTEKESAYFAAVSSAMGIEYEARKYTTSYLKDGIIDPA